MCNTGGNVESYIQKGNAIAIHVLFVLLDCFLTDFFFSRIMTHTDQSRVTYRMMTHLLPLHMPALSDSKNMIAFTTSSHSANLPTGIRAFVA